MASQKQGYIETVEGVHLVHWFDKDGNEHVNGMGAIWEEKIEEEGSDDVSTD